MKMKIIAAVSLTFLFANAALAIPCGPNDAKLIDAGLKNLATDTGSSAINREKASFVSTLIANEPNLKCNFLIGIAGNVYQLRLSTHNVAISFLGSSIDSLSVERTNFN